MRPHIIMGRTCAHRPAAALFCALSLASVSDALLHSPLREHAIGRERGAPAAPPRASSTALGAFFADGGDDDKGPSAKSVVGVGGSLGSREKLVNGSGGGFGGGVGSPDLVRTLALKDEALLQAQTAVASLESALESAVSNLEDIQRQLQLRVSELELESEATRTELDATRTELEDSRSELRGVKRELIQSTQEVRRLEAALAKSEVSAKRADQLEAYVATLNDMDAVEPAPAPPPPAERKEASSQWQLFSTQAKAFPMLDEWIAIKGANEGEVQISGKVTGHPTIPDGDAIVTSPLRDPGRAAERRVVATLSGSKYKLGTQMTMPTGDSASQTIASEKKERRPRRQQLVRARSSISIPDLTGYTLGNGRYLLAGDPTSSINGRSFIQTAYRASPFGKSMGEPLAIKFSPNREAMKREYANYQRVSAGLKRGSFIRRVEFLPVAGDEMPDQSALVMQRGVADVKAFMPKVGGRLEGELLLDCALTALRCVEALHSVRLVWNDLKTENFVVIEDSKGGVSFRGIDLESCMTVRTPPVDYTPEACPPEFAQCFLDGDAESFSLEYSYDVWSFGMFLYEIATGRGFFDGYSAEKITKSLPTFRPTLEKVEDPVLADLISQCLSRNPKDRPSIVRIFKHPFFADATSAKTPFDFLFGI